MYAEAVFATEFRGRTVGQYVELVVAAQIERDAHEFRLSRCHAADREPGRSAIRRRSPTTSDCRLKLYGEPLQSAALGAFAGLSLCPDLSRLSGLLQDRRDRTHPVSFSNVNQNGWYQL